MYGCNRKFIKDDTFWGYELSLGLGPSIKGKVIALFLHVTRVDLRLMMMSDTSTRLVFFRYQRVMSSALGPCPWFGTQPARSSPLTAYKNWCNYCGIGGPESGGSRILGPEFVMAHVCHFVYSISLKVVLERDWGIFTNRMTFQVNEIPYTEGCKVIVNFET